MLRRIFHLKIWTKTGENSVFSRLLNFCPIITHSSTRRTMPVAFIFYLLHWFFLSTNRIFCKFSQLIPKQRIFCNSPKIQSPGSSHRPVFLIGASGLSAKESIPGSCRFPGWELGFYSFRNTGITSRGAGTSTKRPPSWTSPLSRSCHRQPSGRYTRRVVTPGYSTGATR